MSAARPRSILISGFGPFPGVPVNVSARLAEDLTEAVRGRWPQHRTSLAVLPTEWVAGPKALHELWDDLLPDIALHFGVAQDACGLQLETTARNHCRMDADAAGALPLSVERIAAGPDVRASLLPIEAIMRRLRILRIPSCISEDAGAYLCNTVLYESVSRAWRARPVALAGFVHIPPVLRGVEDAQGEAHHAAAPLSIEEAVVGGLAILECGLEHLTELRREVAATGRPQYG